MASGMSNYLENQLLDFIFRGYAMTIGGKTATWSASAPKLYVALGTGTLTDDSSTFTELSTGTGSYARAAAAAGASQASTDWNATQGGTAGASSATTAGANTTTNAITVTFPTATADWNSAATIPDFAIYDAASGGNMLYWGSLTTARAVTNGTTASFSAASLTVSAA